MRQTRLIDRITRWSGLGVLLGLGFLTAACSSIPLGTSDTVARDIQEIKETLNQQADQQQKSRSTVEYSINNINERLQEQADNQQASVEDMTKHIRSLEDELGKMRQQVQTLSYTVERNGGGTLGTQPGSGFGNPANPANPAGPGAGGQQGLPAAEQAYADGVRLMNGGQYPEAQQSLLTALSNNPRPELRLNILYDLGVSLMQTKNYDSASDYFSQLIKANNTHPKAWQGLERLAEIDELQGRDAAALEKLRAIERTNPDYPDLPRVRASIQRLQRGGSRTGAPSRAAQ